MINHDNEDPGTLNNLNWLSRGGSSFFFEKRHRDTVTMMGALEQVVGVGLFGDWFFVYIARTAQFLPK